MINEEKYYGNYVGIVVQNNDPEQCGKVKVFIPHLSPISHSNWVVSNTDKFIEGLVGSNSSKDIISMLDEIKNKLPWAEYAAPLVGENTTGRFNAYNKIGTVSDSNYLSTTFSGNSGSDVSIGNKPSHLYNKEITLNDGFDKASNNVNRPNPLSYNYQPNSYSNAAKGSFAIPAVGSHVWIFFREGNLQFPVYFAASFGQSDWSTIFLSAGDVDYPGTYENKSIALTAQDPNIAAYRNKYVINQKGGTLEFNNTDLNEKVKLSHYSGSFKEMNNEATIELASNNKNTLVLNDTYTTTKGFKNEYTGKDLDEIVIRDKYKKIGSLNDEKFREWKVIASSIQEVKQLFEIKRTTNNSVKNSDDITILKRNSVLQEKAGTLRDNPVTDGTLQYSTLQGASIATVSYEGENADNITLTTPTQPAAAAANPAPVGDGLSPSTQDGTWDVEENKAKLSDIVEAQIQELTRIEQDLGIGGSEIIQISKHKVETIGLEMNNFGSYRLDPIGKLTGSEVKIDSNAVYLDKEGTPLLEYVHVQDLPGGTSTLNVSNRYNVMVGAGGLNLKSYGPTNITGSITNLVGEQVNIGSENEINIDSDIINISANILRMRNKRQKQVLIETNLGVNKNVVIGGGLHVEGETYLQHVTAPREYQETELTHASLTVDAEFTATIAGTDDGNGGLSNGGTHTVTIVSSDNNVVKEHSHAFANLPLTLKDTNALVRTAAGSLTDADRDVAANRVNEKK